MPFLIALGVAVLLVPFLARAGRRVSLVDRPGEPLKIHPGPVPLVGGLAVVAGAVAALALRDEQLSGAAFAAVGLALAAGLLDDLRPQPASLRLVLLLMAGSLLAAEISGHGLLGLGGAAGAALLLAAAANAVNVMDGQDGLAGGLAAIAALGMAAAAGRAGDVAGVALGLSLAGGLVGFLVWNRPPARVFLGNGGAYAVGALLAALAIHLIRAQGLRGFVAAGLALGVFAFELTLTVARRLAAGNDPTVGDREHSYDLMARRTRRREATTVAFWAAGALLASLAVVAVSLPLPVSVAIGAGSALGAGGMALRLSVAAGRAHASP